MYRTHSPYGSDTSSYPGTVPYAPQLVPLNGNVQPNDTAYAQVMSPDGRVLYQIFRANPASYQTASGMINGIQWMAAETVTSPPPGSKPANPEFVASWARTVPGGQGSFGVPVASSSKSSKSDRDREKSSKRKSHSRHQSDYDFLPNARERDSHGHRRTSSYNASVAPVPFPGGSQGGYTAAQPPIGYPGQGGYYPGYGDPNMAAAGQYGAPGGPYGIPGGPPPGQAYSDVTRKMNDLDINRSKESKSAFERDRRTSEHRSRRQSTHEPSRPDPYGGYGSSYNAPGGMYPPIPGAYPGAGSTHSANPSPNMKPGEVPYPVPGGFPPVPYASSLGAGGRQRSNSTAARVAGDVYPPGHILEGQPRALSNSNSSGPSKSRSTTPNPPNAAPYHQSRPSSRMGRASPNPPNPGSVTAQLAAPESFSRAINASLPFHNFRPTKVHNMDDFFTNMPKMPPALDSHDVRNEDWFRFVEDVTLAWTGRLPVNSRDAKPPRPAVVAAELFHTWNTAFFEPRGIEIVLYKGRQRRSGRLFGRVDLAAEAESDESSESSSESSSDSDDPYPPPPNSRDSHMDDPVVARRRYYDQKMQTKERRRERRRRRRERRKSKTYAFYAVCTREGAPKGQSAVPPPMMQNNMPVPSAYPGMLAMPQPPASKKSKSRGQSGLY